MEKIKEKNEQWFDPSQNNELRKKWELDRINTHVTKGNGKSAPPYPGSPGATGIERIIENFKGIIK